MPCHAAHRAADSPRCVQRARCARCAPTGRIGRLSSHLFCDFCTKQMTQTGLILLKALIARAINEHGNWNTIIDRSLKIHNQQHDHSFLIIQTHHHYNNSTTHCTMRPRHADPTWRNKTQVDATVAAMLASRGYLRQYKRTTEVNNHKKKAGSWPW